MLFTTTFLPFLKGYTSQGYLAYAQEDEFGGEELPDATDGGSNLLSREEDEGFEESEENSDIFLVNTPKDVEIVNPRSEDGRWRYPDNFSLAAEKPGFSLYIGAARKDHGISIVRSPKIGLEVGFLTDLYAIPKVPVSLKVGGGVSAFNMGAVQDEKERILDVVYRFGAFLEISLHRRFQILFGALHHMSRPVNIGEDVDADTLSRIQETRFAPGGGAQVEFKVVPYGSMGLLFWLEERYFSVLLTLSMAPVPRSEREILRD